MVTDHEETIERFKSVANNGQQQEIREWAAAKVPNLEHHLEMATQMERKNEAKQAQ